VGAAAHGADPDGDWVPARQAALVGALQQLSALEHGTHTLPDLLTGHLGHGPAESAVRTWLHDIRALEELLGRMDELFAWMRCVTAQARSWHWMEGQLQEQWQQAPWWTAPASERIEHALNLLQGLVASDDLEPFRAFSNALASGDPQGCLKALLQRNRTVVTQRDRRPWLVSHGGTLRAEITSQRATLRSAPAWEHSYYLAELQRVVRECRVALPDGVVG
jgi:hypothetical protein